MSKRKKFHEVRYPKRRLSKGRNSAEHAQETVSTCTGGIGIHIRRNPNSEHDTGGS